MADQSDPEVVVAVEVRAPNSEASAAPSVVVPDPDAPNMCILANVFIPLCMERATLSQQAPKLLVTEA